MALDQKILDYQLTPQEADRIMNMVLERAVGSSIVKDGGMRVGTTVGDLQARLVDDPTTRAIGVTASLFEAVVCEGQYSDFGSINERIHFLELSVAKREKEYPRLLLKAGERFVNKYLLAAYTYLPNEDDTLSWMPKTFGFEVEKKYFSMEHLLHYLPGLLGWKYRALKFNLTFNWTSSHNDRFSAVQLYFPLTRIRGRMYLGVDEEFFLDQDQFVSYQFENKIFGTIFGISTSAGFEKHTGVKNPVAMVASLLRSEFEEKPFGLYTKEAHSLLQVLRLVPLVAQEIHQYHKQTLDSEEAKLRAQDEALKARLARVEKYE